MIKRYLPYFYLFLTVAVLFSIRPLAMMVFADDNHLTTEVGQVGELIQQVGLPIALLAVILWFGIKYIWPSFEKEKSFLVSQIESLQKGRDISEAKYLESMNKMVGSLEKLEDIFNKHNEKVAEKLNSMHNDINRNR